MSEYIVDLDDLSREKVAEAGGKGALLGELLSRGYPVPKGFCLTVPAYDEFLQISGIGEEIKEVHALPPAEMQQAAQGIHDHIEEAAIPADLAVTLSTLYRALGQRPRVAVRPSPAYDNRLRNPIPGLVEPHLNVLGEKDLFQAVRDTWASIWLPEVLLFCQRQGLDHARLKPAVIMQIMIHPVASGTIFTGDPVTGDRDRLLITASWGMGQGSLGGQNTPDTYHIDRETRAIRYKRIVTKEVMVSSSGIVPVPKNRRNTVVIKDSAIRELCDIALGIEDILKEPVEIEWCAVTNGQLMVLEALPVAGGEEGPTEEQPVAAAMVDRETSRYSDAEEGEESESGVEPETASADVPASRDATAEPEEPEERETGSAAEPHTVAESDATGFPSEGTETESKPENSSEQAVPQESATRSDFPIEPEDR